MYKYLNNTEIRDLNKRVICLVKFKSFISGNDLHQKYLNGKLNYEEIVELMAIFQKLNYTPDEFSFNKILGYFKKLKFKNLKEAQEAMELVLFGDLKNFYSKASKKKQQKIKNNFINYKMQIDKNYSKFVKYKMNLDEAIYYMENIYTQDEVWIDSYIFIDYLYKFKIINYKLRNNLLDRYKKLQNGYNEDVYGEGCFYEEILKEVTDSKYDICGLFFSDLSPGLTLNGKFEKAFKSVKEDIYDTLEYKPGDTEIDGTPLDEFVLADYFGDDGYLICVDGLKIDDKNIDFINTYLQDDTTGVATEVYSENGNFHLNLSSNVLLDGLNIKAIFALLLTLRRITR